MNDRELLEKAAKAAGIDVLRSRLDDPACIDFLIRKSPRNIMQELGPWNPLTDDGDAMRLVVKLRLDIGWQPALGYVVVYSTTCDAEAKAEYEEYDEEGERIDINRPAALRLAITRAAAAMAND